MTERRIDWRAFLNKLVYWTSARFAVDWLIMSVRFWDRVDRSGGCWIWKGSLSPRGYGWFWWNGKNQRAHRVAWELTYGPITEPDINVLHDCDTPSCVNPSHLFLGTDADNMRDKVQKGRQTKGEAVNTSKLTEARVLDMRERYAAGESQADLAQRFGVIRPQVSKIIRGIDWKHVGGDIAKNPRRDLQRQVRGEDVKVGKLIAEKVREIRARALKGERQTALAREFRVSDAAISAIVKRKTWRHV